MSTETKQDVIRQMEEATKDKEAIIQLLVDKITVNGKGEVSINFAIPEPKSVEAYCMISSILS